MIINHLNWQIKIGEQYQKCMNENQVEWLKEQLMDMVECLADERLEELEKELEYEEEMEEMLEEYEDEI